MNTGQAALEFLTTYGWAILVVLAAITALSYFGVLSPDRFLPNKCTMTPGFWCTEAAATSNRVHFSVLNNVGKDLVEYRVRFENPDLLRFENPLIGNGQSCSDSASDLSTTPQTSAFLRTFAATEPPFEHAFFRSAGAPRPVWQNGEAATMTIGQTEGVLEHCPFKGKVEIDFTVFYKESGGALEHQAQGRMELHVRE